MFYKRPPRTNRKYLHTDTGTDSKGVATDINTDIIKETVKIPLPTEVEISSDTAENTRGAHKPSIFNILKGRITIEEIILLGLIVLLLDEGIEDDMILILLIYILLT